MISYLPALYGAYSRREARLLTLDDPQGGRRIVPVRVIAVNAPGGDLEMLYRVLRGMGDVDGRRAREPRVVPDAGVSSAPSMQDSRGSPRWVW